jgi:hypothetical protein
MRVGILTGGGDCPGLNAVIRAAAKTLFSGGVEVLGFRDGYRGIIEKDWMPIDKRAISGLLHRGGTILGTNNRDNPFNFPVVTAEGKTEYCDVSDQLLQNMQQLKLDNLISIGGDGTLSIARELVDKGAHIVGVPKTIDNDLAATDQTFGFDTAVATATGALDKLHTTAESHPRAMDDLDACVINSNHAIEANLNPVEDSIFMEPKDSPFGNVLVVRAKDKDKEAIKKLGEALQSPEVKEFLEEKYQGSCVPTF